MRALVAGEGRAAKAEASPLAFGPGLGATGKIADNNEVTLEIRHHAGGFPWAAVPGPIGPPKFPFKVEKNEFLVATSETSPKPLGFVSDAVRFRKVARFA
jgi:hypothetical protein